MKKFNIPIKFILGIIFTSLSLISRPTLAVNDVLMLSTTVTTGQEQAAATALGLSVDVVTPAQWASMTTAQFAAYKAIVLGDPQCVGGTVPIAAAVTNKTVWGPAITGNVMIFGADESYHRKTQVSQNGIAFAASSPGKTGAYISLSCYYDGTAPLTPVPLLDAFVPGGFTVADPPGCFNAAHLVATHPALVGLTDAYLSNWSCSVHEIFDSWPISFEVLAIALTGDKFTAPDGTQGTPYVLARGVTVISDINLDPDNATNPVGSSHTLTATVKEDATPVVGTTVTFTVIAGPNFGATGTGVTDASGEATWSYSSTVAGTDTIEATFVDRLGRTQRSDRVTKEWKGLPPIACNAGTDFTKNEATAFSLSGLGSSGGVAPLSYSWTHPIALTGANTATPSGTTPVVSSNTDYTFTLTVSDSAGQSASCDVVLTVVDSDKAPDCSNATASPDLLWPPNHKLIKVGVTGVVDTGAGSGATILMTSARQDEPTNGLGDGDTGPDAALDGATARVRAERSGLENGRVVYLGFTATDALGQSCTGTVKVGIPHDVKDTPIGEGPLFDATVE